MIYFLMNLQTRYDNNVEVTRHIFNSLLRMVSDHLHLKRKNEININSVEIDSDSVSGFKNNVQVLCNAR